MKEIEVYHLDDLPTEREFGMDIKVCERLGHFNNKVALEYVVLNSSTDFKPHCHNESDALVLIISGKGYITNQYLERVPMKQGTIVYFPAKTRHGFLTEDEQVHLVTIQSPPIKDLQTGKIDFIE
jgi:quercetin dioxygenase-like cupin family protein